MKEGINMSQYYKKYVYGGLMTAVIIIATVVVKIPAINGYLNFGDCFVILSGILLGPLYGGLASGIGSAVSDVVSGFALYAPATFVIKFLMSVVSYYVYKKHGAVLSVILTEMTMVLGYFLFETVIYGVGVSSMGILWNLLQGTVCGVIAVILIKMRFLELMKKND